MTLRPDPSRAFRTLAGTLALALCGAGCWYSLDPVNNDNQNHPPADAGPDADAPDGDVDAAPDAALTDAGSDASPDAANLCGNGTLDTGEACDGSQLDGETCKTRGHLGGPLACDACQFDETGCWDTCGGATGHNCPASSISDDFDDQVRGPLWGYSYQNGSASYQETASGKLRFTLPANENNYAGYLTGFTYDLRDDAITLEILETPNVTHEEAELSFEVLDDGSGDYAGITLSGGILSGFYWLGSGPSVPIAPILFEASQHAYWRLREANGDLHWDTSPDGISWTPRGSVASPIPLGNVRIAITAGCWGSVPDPGSGTVDNFNLLP